MHRVLAVMLVNGREQMVQRAIRSFRSQTYPDKVLVIVDSGDPPLDLESDHEIIYSRLYLGKIASIGELRNIANATPIRQSENLIIAHWDSDDWSAPDRISDQVSLLESTGAQVVGYREMLFWDSTKYRAPIADARTPYFPKPGCDGEAWLYSNPNPDGCLGTSLCYWRATWEKQPFPHLNTAEDLNWLNGTGKGLRPLKASSTSAGVNNPRMIASIHGGNTCSKIKPGAKEWRRLPALDEYCAGVMKL